MEEETRMAQGTKTILMGLAGLALAACGPLPMAAQPQTAPAQQPQAIPDAPKPQALPSLRTLTPAGPAVTVPDGPVPATKPATDSQAVPGALPSAPAGQKATAHATDEDDIPPAKPTDFVLPAQQVNFVEVPFTVKDSKGQLVPGLTPRDVRVYENGFRQSTALFTVDPFPLSVAVVIDQSVTFDTMEKVNSSLGALQGAFTPYDSVAVFTYNTSVTMQDGFDAAQSKRLGVILERSKGKGTEPVMGLGGPLAATNNINGHNVDPVTAPIHNSQGTFITPPKEFHPLNDAILAAARETAKAAPGRRRIVYVISDGKEYGSTAKEKEVIQYCQTNKVAVYATLVGDSAIRGLGFLDRIHLPLTMRDDVLPRYAGATGGQVDPEVRPKGIEQSFARITEEVRTQYTIGYYSHEPAIDGKFRKLEVRVARPNLTIIAKEGYYPTVSSGGVAPPRPATPSATP